MNPTTIIAIFTAFCMVGILIVLWGAADRQRRHNRRKAHDNTIWQIRQINERGHTNNLLKK